jgi:hypothetical protein
MIQSDGKIVVAGSTDDGSGGYSGRFALVRYNKDGSLDPSFGVGGSVIQMFPNASAYKTVAVLQPDGRICRRHRFIGKYASPSRRNGRFDRATCLTVFSCRQIPLRVTVLQPNGKIAAGSYSAVLPPALTRTAADTGFDRTASQRTSSMHS